MHAPHRYTVIDTITDDYSQHSVCYALPAVSPSFNHLRYTRRVLGTHAGVTVAHTRIVPRGNDNGNDMPMTADHTESALDTTTTSDIIH